MEQQEKLISKLKSNLPKNLILVAPKYFGKKTLVKEITDLSYVWVDHNIEAIRQLEYNDNHVFIDIDDWSVSSFGALLKLLEDGTGHNIITCKNISNVPDTIQSRCVIELMEPYRNINKYCNSIGEIQYYSDEMIKSIDKFEYSEDYDFDVFFSVACNRLLERISNGENLTREYLITSIYNSSKGLKSLNKKQFITNWQFDIIGATKSYMNL